jgi:hypothetical protein
VSYLRPGGLLVIKSIIMTSEEFDLLWRVAVTGDVAPDRAAAMWQRSNRLGSTLDPTRVGAGPYEGHLEEVGAAEQRALALARGERVRSLYTGRLRTSGAAIRGAGHIGFWTGELPAAVGVDAGAGVGAAAGAASLAGKRRRPDTALTGAAPEPKRFAPDAAEAAASSSSSSSSSSSAAPCSGDGEVLHGGGRRRRTATRVRKPAVPKTKRAAVVAVVPRTTRRKSARK